jgi:YHS domain-containing protein
MGRYLLTVGSLFICLLVGKGFAAETADPQVAELRSEIASLKQAIGDLLKHLEKLESRLPGTGQGTPSSDAAGATPILMLEGFCPVTLADENRWTPGNPEFSQVHRGRQYRFASDAKYRLFVENPDKYAPVLDGHDVVVALRESRKVPGVRRHGMWYRGHIFLFAGEDTLATFIQSPDLYLMFAVRERELESGCAPLSGSECRQLPVVASPAYNR